MAVYPIDTMQFGGYHVKQKIQILLRYFTSFSSVPLFIEPPMVLPTGAIQIDGNVKSTFEVL